MALMRNSVGEVLEGIVAFLVVFLRGIGGLV